MKIIDLKTYFDTPVELEDLASFLEVTIDQLDGLSPGVLLLARANYFILKNKLISEEEQALVKIPGHEQPVYIHRVSDGIKVDMASAARILEKEDNIGAVSPYEIAKHTPIPEGKKFSFLLAEDDFSWSEINHGYDIDRPWATAVAIINELLNPVSQKDSMIAAIVIEKCAYSIYERESCLSDKQRVLFGSHPLFGNISMAISKGRILDACNEAAYILYVFLTGKGVVVPGEDPLDFGMILHAARQLVESAPEPE